MSKNNIPSDEKIRKELHQAFTDDPKLKCCANCTHYCNVRGYCSKLEKVFPSYMYGCRHYITAEEMLIARARAELTAQARECEKIEFLLAMGLTIAGTTSLIIEDFDRRVRRLYEKEKSREATKLLKKDLDMSEQMRRAFKNIKDYQKKIEAQFRFYIQPHLDKIFNKEGIGYNAEGYDQYLADSGEFATFLLEMARVAHHNRDNMDEIYDRMRQMRNNNPSSEDNTFCLDDKDIEHYRLKQQ